MYKVYVDGGVNRVRDACKAACVPMIMPDMVVGDLDSVDDLLLEELRKQKSASGASINILYRYDQDRHDFDKALTEYRREIKTVKTGPLVVLGGLGGRRDQELANITSAVKAVASTTDGPVFPIHLIGHENTSVLVLPPGHTNLSIPEGMVTGPEASQTYVGLFPFGEDSVTSTDGLQWDLHKSLISTRGLVSSSNRFTKTTVAIDTSTPVCMTISSPLI